ncbi:MAG: hypothetical protein ACRCYU_15985 [Nocardioides sp.]
MVNACWNADGDREHATPLCPDHVRPGQEGWRRAAELDRQFALCDGTLEEMARTFVEAVGDVAPESIADEDAPIVDPDDVDSALGRSNALRRLRSAAPWLDDGPDSTAGQQLWLATARPDEQRAPQYTPVESAFRFPWPHNGWRPERGERGGLSTTTGHSHFHGMWQHYVQLNCSQIRGKPWMVWAVDPLPDVTLMRISSARDWVTLIDEHSLAGRTWVDPDWQSIAEVYDGVHFTPAAVCAIEGSAFASRAGTIRPTYWAVESTLWLRWRFAGFRRLAG